MKKLHPDLEDTLQGVLDGYGVTPIVALAIRFFLRNPYESLLIVDKEGHIEYMDRGSEKSFGLSPGGGKGIKVKELINDSLLPKVLDTKNPIIGGVFDFKDQKKVGSVYPLIRDGELIGGMGRLILHSLNELERINNQVNSLKKKVSSLRQRKSQQYKAYYTFESILGKSDNIKQCIELSKKVAITGADVLIMGESGTGKELFAQAIHNFARPEKPFVTVNAPAIPFELAESEFFGYKRGAFSGAEPAGKPGKFELADNGTLFLDEISSLPLSIQPKLLRAIQEREIQTLGDTQTKHVNFQLISTTNEDLKQSVTTGKFRNDLFYRLAKITIQIDPLRKRKGDIPIIANHFLKTINARFGTHFKNLSHEATECLMNYDWLGNVRELINVLEQACLKEWKGNEITISGLPSEITESKSMDACPSALNFKNMTQETERTLIHKALERTNGNKRRAAMLLGLPRSTLYKKIKEFNMAV